MLILCCIVIFVVLFYILHKAGKIKLTHSIIISIIAMMLIVGIYTYLGNADKIALRDSNQEEALYYVQLLENNKQGSLDDLIKLIQARLVHYPNSAEGWLILSKLYATKGDQESAGQAQEKANTLIDASDE